MIPLREIDVLGVFVAPFALCLPIAMAVTVLVTMVLRRIPDVMPSPLLALTEIAMFVGSLSGLVLMLGRS